MNEVVPSGVPVIRVSCRCCETLAAAGFVQIRRRYLPDWHPARERGDGNDLVLLTKTDEVIEHEHTRGERYE
jgi:hypothetical protein